MRYRIAVIDAAPNLTPAEVQVQRGARLDPRGDLPPWVTIVDPITSKRLSAPPSGFVAGVSRNDVNRGVWKAPANEVVNLGIGFERSVTAGVQETLNQRGINCLRSLENRGHRIGGARTMVAPTPNGSTSTSAATSTTRSVGAVTKGAGAVATRGTLDSPHARPRRPAWNDQRGEPRRHDPRAQGVPTGGHKWLPTRTVARGRARRSRFLGVDGARAAAWPESTRPQEQQHLRIGRAPQDRQRLGRLDVVEEHPR